MKRILATVLSAVLMMGTMAGCASKDDASGAGVADVNAQKYVTSLGEYKGMELSAAKEEITDEYLDSYIQYVMESNPVKQEVTGRAVQTGDTVNIDYVGKKDDVAFEGGTAQGYDLTIGSGQFIPGFEDGLIGANIGDVVDLNLTFPEEYHSADLAGQEVVFTVTINSISESFVPELTDEYVAGLTTTNSSTVEEYKAELRAELEANAEASYQNTLQSQVLENLVGNATFKEELPESLLSYYRTQMDISMQNYANSFQMDTQEFISTFYGMTQEQYEETKEQNAVMLAQRSLACMMIAEKEGIEVTDEELNQAVEQNYANFGFESVEAYMESGDAENYRHSLLTQKVIEMLVDNAVVVEPTETTTEATAE